MHRYQWAGILGLEEEGGGISIGISFIPIFLFQNLDIRSILKALSSLSLPLSLSISLSLSLFLRTVEGVTMDIGYYINEIL
jgi:hypothetical protein